jgi:hypothetical protein
MIITGSQKKVSDFCGHEKHRLLLETRGRSVLAVRTSTTEPAKQGYVRIGP